MNRALIGLLALSLAGNVTLYWLTHRHSPAPVAVVTLTTAVHQKTASVEANATLQVFAQRLRLAQGSSSSTNTITQERIATQAAFAARLETLLGTEAAAAYRKEGNGRIFTPPNRPTIPTTPTPPKG